jgi:hypothetical protein
MPVSGQPKIVPGHIRRYICKKPSGFANEIHNVSAGLSFSLVADIADVVIAIQRFAAAFV